MTRIVPSISIRDIAPEHLARCAPGSPLLEAARAHIPRRDEEHNIQSALFVWIFATEERIPELKLAYAVPNFSGRGKSKRARQFYGARLQREGRRKGMLDVCWPIARSGYHGAYLEMKTPDGSLSKEQRWYRDALRAEGHCVYVPRRWEAARDFMLEYHSGVLP